MKDWGVLADQSSVEKTVKNFRLHGMDVFVTKTGKEALDKALSLIPTGAEVMTMTSQTNGTIGLTQAIDESGRYDSVRKKLLSFDRETQGGEMRKLAAAPDWAVGSVHAATQEGEALIASNTGSQLPAYLYGAGHVLWIVGTQKIVKDREEGLRRIYEYTLPLESERAHKAYGVNASAVNKIAIINNEVQPGRITMILVGEKLGF